MNSKAIQMGVFICPVCGVPHSDGAPILMNKKLKDIKPENTLCGVSLCGKHQAESDQGYKFLCEVTNPVNEGSVLTNKEAVRTGRVMSIHENDLRQLLQDVPEASFKLDYMYIHQEAFTMLENVIDNINQG